MMDVEEDHQSPSIFKRSIETNVEPQYLCQFTMLLMDTVEELTVRVSQIDFVCRQHFPDLQTLSQSIQNKILGFDKSGQLEWRKKEDSLLRRIHELESESRHSEAQINQMHASLEETKEKLMNKEQMLNRCEREKKEFLEQLVQKVNEAVKAKEIKEDLLKQIELKDKELEVELSRKKSFFEEFNRLKTNYKRLKSQYNFLLTKLGSGMTNTPHSDMMEDENGISNNCPNKRFIEDVKNNIDQKECVTDNATAPKKSTIKQGHAPPKPPPNPKPEPASGSKRPTSRWRGTRTRQELKAGDPHDDFLDTPIEIVQNLNAEYRRAKQNLDPDDNDACSDEETVDINLEIRAKTAVSVAGPSNKKFKYVEPVRRKVERENLRGVECKQCKKFYDAVLLDGGEDGAAARCEHQDGASRHRYRYAPPSTPEGFWNIGFDSDL